MVMRSVARSPLAPWAAGASIIRIPLPQSSFNSRVLLVTVFAAWLMNGDNDWSFVELRACDPSGRKV